MIGAYQALDLARQPRWVQAIETPLEVPCPLLGGKKNAPAVEAEGTVEVRLNTPPHDLFVQRPFPLVASE